MEKLIRARFLQAFDFVMAKENLTQKELCVIIKQSPPYISDMRSRERAQLKASVLGSLCSKYRYINPFWVMTGEGSMQAIPEDLKEILKRIDKKVDERMAELIKGMIEIKTPPPDIYRKPSKS